MHICIYLLEWSSMIPDGRDWSRSLRGSSRTKLRSEEEERGRRKGFVTNKDKEYYVRGLEIGI